MRQQTKKMLEYLGHAVEAMDSAHRHVETLADQYEGSHMQTETAWKCLDSFARIARAHPNPLVRQEVGPSAKSMVRSARDMATQSRLTLNEVVEYRDSTEEACTSLRQMLEELRMLAERDL